MKTDLNRLVDTFVAEVLSMKDESGLGKLQMLLVAIETNDEKYVVRYGLIMLAIGQAHAMGLEVGFRIDPNEPDWPVVYIELPTGQVSWHLPKHTREWDGHTTEEKYQRIRDFAKLERL